MGIVKTVEERAKKKKRALPEKKSGDDAKLLECVVCVERYSRNAILTGEYRIETMVCSACYAKMQRAPFDVSCFGKPTTVEVSGRVRKGYDPRDEDCRSRCPDRKVCSLLFPPASTFVHVQKGSSVILER